MALRFRVVCIGTLSHHELWQEKQPKRTPFATTVLIHADQRVILVDPGLPPEAMSAQLLQRSGLEPRAVTDVFLTNFRPAHRRGLELFDSARWYLAEAERESVGHRLVEMFQQEQADEELKPMLQQEIGLLKRCEAAPDKLAEGVDLFPLPGFTPGTCGLLLLEPQRTILVAGDAVPTVEHLEQGRVLSGGFDREQAQESFKEAIEIADAIIPGHDNVVLNPLRRAASQGPGFGPGMMPG
jgi:glyoxylase-like metal-dependent hydrolase (beta-lactamase superfamily II)